MTLLARCARIRNDAVRIHLLAILFPIEMARFAWWMLWRSPRRLLSADCWQTTFVFYRAAMNGTFVGLGGNDEQ